MSKWIKFVEKEKKAKTKVYSVITRSDGVEIGEVKWYSSWRCYCFFPFFETVFSEACSLEIWAFMIQLNEEHKKNWKKPKHTKWGMNPDILRSLEELHKEKTIEEIAKQFHETYERLAPKFNYKTRKKSQVAWEDLPENNRKLMIAVCKEIIENKRE